MPDERPRPDIDQVRDALREHDEAQEEPQPDENAPPAEKGGEGDDPDAEE
jgi:hypothetical protein